MNEIVNNSEGISTPMLIENCEEQFDIKKSLLKVHEGVAMTIGDIEVYSEQLEKNNEPPSLEKKWYQPSIVTPKELNTTFKNFHDFVYRSFNLINVILEAQNNNTKDLCNIILLISAAEVQLYKQLKELTTIDQEDIIKLQDLEKKFLKSLQNDEKDKKTTYEQFEKLIDLMQEVELAKNKWIRSLEVKINDVYLSIDRNIEEATNNLKAIINEDRKEQERSINATKEEINTHVNNLKEIKEGIKQQQIGLHNLIDGLPEEIRKLCDERFYKMQQTLSTAQESFQSNFSQTTNNRLEKQDDKLALQDAEINKLKRKTFFDSKIYKIGIGIIAIAALVCSLVL